MNHTLLIADDEEWIRKGFLARLEYLNLQPQAVYEASSGEEALKLIKEVVPDIVVTDIRMPDMDGIQLIQESKLLYPHIQFIILSGYAEFAYAEKAIQLGVKAYLLKPLSNDALQKTITEVLTAMKKEKTTKQTIQNAIKTARENVSFLVEKGVNDLIHNSGELENIDLDSSEEVEKVFSLKWKYFMVIIINIDGDTYSDKQFHYEDIELLRFSVQNVFNELPSDCSKIIANNLVNRNQLFAIMAHSNEKILKQGTQELLTNLMNSLWKKMRLPVTIGISDTSGKVGNRAYGQAQEAFAQRMIHGGGSIYFYGDIKVMAQTNFPTTELDMLTRYIQRQDAANIEILLEDLFSQERIEQNSTTYIRIIWVKIISILLKSSNAYVKDMEPLDISSLSSDNLERFQTIEELIKYLYTLIIKGMQKEQLTDVNSKNKIKLAVQYIEENFHLDIAINDLADKYAMSPNYFSAAFRRETNMTTLNYIKELRIKKACELLAHTHKCVADISKEVGYEDSQYFFRVFKKTTGYTPLEYRKLF